MYFILFVDKEHVPHIWLLWVYQWYFLFFHTAYSKQSTFHYFFQSWYFCIFSFLSRLFKCLSSSLKDCSPFSQIKRFLTFIFCTPCLSNNNFWFFVGYGVNEKVVRGLSKLLCTGYDFWCVFVSRAWTILRTLVHAWLWPVLGWCKVDCPGSCLRAGAQTRGMAVSSQATVLREH